MSSRVQLDGMAEFQAALTNMPEQMRRKAMAIVRETTEGAASEGRAVYRRHKRTGNLADHVKTSYPSSQIAVGEVRSTGKHAHLFEWGSQLRQTLAGANRGRMPPAGPNGIVPVFRRRRRAMNDDLIEMVKGEGFQVSGGF